MTYKDSNTLGKFDPHAVLSQGANARPVDVRGEELKAAYQRIEQLIRALQRIADLPPPEHLTRPYKRTPQQIAISALRKQSSIEPFPSCAPGV